MTVLAKAEIVALGCYYLGLVVGYRLRKYVAR